MTPAVFSKVQHASCQTAHPKLSASIALLYVESVCAHNVRYQFAELLQSLQMGFAGFLGNLLIAGGPGLAIFCVFVAPKSFLVLLFLARYDGLCKRLRALWHPDTPGLRSSSPARSLFAWLISLTLTAALFRGAGHTVPLERAASHAYAASWLSSHSTCTPDVTCYGLIYARSPVRSRLFAAGRAPRRAGRGAGGRRGRAGSHAALRLAGTQVRVALPCLARHQQVLCPDPRALVQGPPTWPGR